MFKKTFLAAAIVALPLLASAAGNAAPGYQRIDLKDGTAIVLEQDGKMRHYDSDGKPMKMAPGIRMEGKDGAVYEMRNNALWQRLWLRGTIRDPSVR